MRLVFAFNSFANITENIMKWNITANLDGRTDTLYVPSVLTFFKLMMPTDDAFQPCLLPLQLYKSVAVHRL